MAALVLLGLTIVGAGVLVYVQQARHNAYTATLIQGFRDEAATALRVTQAQADSQQIALRTQDEAHRRELIRVFADHRSEVQALCQRLQAPEMAVIQHQQETGGPGEAILPLTDEESAEQEQQLRDVIQKIEQAEAESTWP